MQTLAAFHAGSFFVGVAFACGAIFVLGLCAAAKDRGDLFGEGGPRELRGLESLRDVEDWTDGRNGKHGMDGTGGIGNSTINEKTALHEGGANELILASSATVAADTRAGAKLIPSRSAAGKLSQEVGA